MTLATWLAFVAASIAVLIIPGPTISLVVSYALSQGRRAAVAIVLGVALGDLTAMSLSLLGLGALLATSATLFTALRWLGAAYLVYLGIKLWRTRPRQDAGHAGRAGAKRMIGHAWLVTSLNPKSIVFFTAFVPQFLDVHGSYAVQATILTATFVALAALNAGAYALGAARLQGTIRRPGTRRLVDRLAGSALIGAGITAVALHRSR